MMLKPAEIESSWSDKPAEDHPARFTCSKRYKNHAARGCSKCVRESGFVRNGRYFLRWGRYLSGDSDVTRDVRTFEWIERNPDLIRVLSLTRVPMGSRMIVMLTILWLVRELRSESKVTCRGMQLHRSCERLCNTNSDGIISCELRVAVLLPDDPRFDISLPKVLPVLGKA